MAITHRVAASMAEALALTPHQIITMARAMVRLSSGPGEARPRARRGTPEEFKAALLGALG